MKKVNIERATALARDFLHKNSAIKKAILVRSCENQGNLSGTVSGWTDVKLTDYGRRQAFVLSQLYEENQSMINHIHSSDLQRCTDTAFYALSFPTNENIV